MSLYVEFMPQELNVETGTQIARGGGGGGEISENLKQALLQLANKVAYIDANGEAYYADLYNALYPIITTYTITNNLTAVTNSNPVSSVVEGGSYTATLSCASNYEITTVIVTMGGIDVTGTSYSSGTISIPSVTGNIVITAVATQKTATLVSITAVFTQGGNVIYDTDSLDTLKQYLVVTATWSDSSTSTVAASDYILSGTLAVGTSTITASYSGETDTFSVTVTEAPVSKYPIPSGTHTFTSGSHNTKSITTSDGNHVEYLQNSGSEATYAIIDPITSNMAAADTTNINSPSTPIFTLNQGDEVVFKIENLSTTASGSGNLDRRAIAIALRSGSTSIVSSGNLYPSDTDKTTTQTISTTTQITCLFVYAGYNVSHVEFDIELYVNGVRWI